MHLKLNSQNTRRREGNGMICAEDEIGLGASHDGILVLPSDAQIGQLAANYFDISSDYMIEIGLTPNRTDAMSHIGVARDLVAGLKAKGVAGAFNKPNLAQVNLASDKQFTIDILSNDCKRYSAVKIDGIVIADSPTWLANRLKAIGVKPINNIVDITNYILHEYGQPLHAFDFNQVNRGEILVKKANHGDVFKTLDGNEIKLNAEDLMICDNQNYLCIAGVYGGLESGVQANTTSILLESAHFDAVSVRKTSQRHQLRTDAAMKFEKCADINITVEALQRAISLIQSICPSAQFSSIADVYPIKQEEVIIELRYDRIIQIAGINIPQNAITDILKDLGFGIMNESPNGWKLNSPSFKADVTREIDVIEEVLRIFGYNKIAFPKFLRSNLTFSNGISRTEFVRHITDYLIGNGYQEIMTNSISQSIYYKDEPFVKLLNSMTSELDCLRPNMMMGGLEVIQYNSNRDQRDLKLFEIGNVYYPKGDKYGQESKLSIFISGKHHEKNWLEKQRIVDVYDAKSLAENLLNKFVAANYTSELNEKGELLFLINQKCVAKVLSISNPILKLVDVKNPVFYIEFDMDYLLKLVLKQKIRYSEVSKYPSVQRDLALLVKEDITYQQIEKIAYQKAKSLLKSISLFDVFKGEKIGAGNKSYAINLKLQDETKTLTDKEIDKTMNQLIESFEKELNAEIRRS
ncbi:MAG: phenylalanine--tRNA ligase subunit beta [Bacteroidetes bacterium]|nr:phenylalanine--tRNA ligase subunit beta [Bacteroidota bacterium]